MSCLVCEGVCPAIKITPPDAMNPSYSTLISGTTIPPRYAISVSVLSMHRNKSIWGPDADDDVPERWFKRDTKAHTGLLMHFGQGHRACIGRNQSLQMLWKAMVEVLRGFEIPLANKEDGKQKHIEMRVTGFAELAKPLNVKVRKRSVSQYAVLQ